MVTTPTPVWPNSRHKMIHTREEVLVWPNSHPRGGGGHIYSSSMKDHANHKHPSMLAQNKNTEDNRQDDSHDDHHRASLYVDINHSRYLPSHHSAKPDKYDGSARVSLQEGIHPAVPDSIGQIELFESPTKLYEEPISLTTVPPHRKTSPQDMSISMDNHSFSPTVTMATLKRYKSVKMDKYKDSHMKSSIRSNMKKDTYNVHGNVSHTNSLLRHESVIKFGNSHKTSTPEDQLKMVEYEASHMEFLAQFHMKRNTYDVPSSARHPKNTGVLNSAMTKNANTLTTNMMNHNSGSLNKSHQVQEKLHHKQMQKALQYKVKTSSDADANQDPDLAKAEGLNPREGITRHSALPVGTEFHRVLASCSNLIAAGQVLTKQL
jgi:hypothetical protein